MKFYRTPMVIIVLIFIIFTSSVSYGNDVDVSIENNLDPDNIIRVAGDKDYPPYEYVDDNGIYKGFNIDIIRAISIELGLDIEIIPMTWDEAVRALEEGEVDAIQGMIKSYDREEEFSFTDNFIDMSQAIFVRKDTKYIVDLKDLSKVRVSFQKGDINYENIKKEVDVIPITKENQYLAMEALLDGEVEAFVGNRFTGLWYLQKHHKIDEIKIVGEPIGVQEYSMTTKKNNDEIISLLNKGLNKIKENGTYDKIYEKWFGETFTDDYGRLKGLFFIVLLILAIAFSVILIIFYWNKRLRIEVENRTKELHNQKLKIDKSNRLRGRVLEGIDSGIIVFNKKGEVLAANTSARNIIEINIELGMKWKELGLSKKIDKYALSYSFRKGSWSNSIQWLDTDGAKQFINCRILPIKGPDGIEGAILLLHDYTKEKNLQDIINHNDKMQALGKLAAGVAHEIRNPLSSIKGLMALVPIKYNDEEFRDRLVKMVNQEIGRLNILVNLLLDYSKPKETVLKVVVVSDIVDEILSLFCVKFKKAQVKVINNSLPLEFLGDVHQIKQVIINLLLNSVDAIDRDGVIEINSYLKDEKIAIEIKDNGCGISKEDIERIFNPFFTLKEDGYGIGLAICHQLIQENKGEIVVKSEIDKGTTMTLYLPAALEYKNDSVASF